MESLHRQKQLYTTFLLQRFDFRKTFFHGIAVSIFDNPELALSRYGVPFVTGGQLPPDVRHAWSGSGFPGASPLRNRSTGTVSVPFSMNCSLPR